MFLVLKHSVTVNQCTYDAILSPGSPSLRSFLLSAILPRAASRINEKIATRKINE